LNPKESEKFKNNNKKKEEVITIGGERKEFIQDADFIKYLGIPFCSKRIAKKKFVEAKMQKFFYQFDKLEFSGLAMNQF
jgi:negative regulator of sigma E activity